MAGMGHVRIDDRLIHGQIVASWMSVLGANTIVVADDAAAADPLQNTLLQMAVPPGTTLKIMPVAEAAAYLSDENTNAAKILLVLRNVKSALAIVNAGLALQKINVGNVSGGAGKKKYTKAVWLNPEEESDFKELSAKGIYLEIQVVPNEKATNLMSALK